MFNSRQKLWGKKKNVFEHGIVTIRTLERTGEKKDGLKVRLVLCGTIIVRSYSARLWETCVDIFEVIKTGEK